MFTGIVETIGVIERVTGGPGGGKRWTVRHELDPASLSLGDSIAHDGVCLTIVHVDGVRYAVDVGPETLARTTVGALNSGARVNLERAMAIGDRIGGHLVQGHVDAVGTVRAVVDRENARDIEIGTPEALAPLIAPRGSIAVDGISLTVTGVGDDWFTVSIIPHTWKVTTLGARKAGSQVNLEADMIARYVARILESRGVAKSGGGITEAFLAEHGF